MMRQDPDAALRINPENALVQARVALQLVEGMPDPQRYEAARALAKKALARDSGNVSALAVLGVTSTSDAEATAIFEAAGELSRRSLFVQLWKIEKAVSEDDVPGALHQYDIALRTSRLAPAILFPILVDAATEDALQPEIAKTLAQRPLWGPLFIQQLGQSARDMPGAARLFVRLKREGVPTGEAADAALYTRLVEAGLYDAAWEIHVADHPRARRDSIGNSAFSGSPAAPTPFEWRMSDTAFVNARIGEGEDAAGRLYFSTASGEGGEAARRMLVLPAGGYRIEVRTDALDLVDTPPPYLRVTCIPTGTETARLPLRPGGKASERFTIPAGCPAQTLALIVQPAGGLATVDGALRYVRIAPE